MQPSSRSLQEYQQERMKFTSTLTFMVTALGFTAGFGSVWRFPYLVFKNGGGTFLLPYMILLFTLGIPMYYLELAIGQIKQLGLPQILQHSNPKFRGFGYVGLFITFYISSYYNLIMAYSLRFAISSFYSPLPWKNNSIDIFNKDYFYKSMIQISTSISDINYEIWPLYATYIFSLAIVYLCIKEGVKTSGKIAIFTATAPYVLLLVLLIRGSYLEGSAHGLYYLFKPDFIKIFDVKVWVDAANQVIYQLGVGQSCVILFGSYRQKQDKLTFPAIAIPLLTASCGLLAACVVFSYIGHISLTTGVSIDDLPLAGPDLAFVLYPAILTEMPLANLWCLVFFICLLLLGIDSQFGYVEALSGSLEDAFLGEIIIYGSKLSLAQTRLFVCFILSLTGLLYCSDIGFYLLQFVDLFGTNVIFIMGILFEVYYFTRSDRFQTLQYELHRTGNIIPKFISYSLTQICHYSVIVLLLFSTYSQILATFNYNILFALCGWCLTLSPYALCYYLYKTEPTLGSISDIEMKLYS